MHDCVRTLSKKLLHEISSVMQQLLWLCDRNLYMGPPETNVSVSSASSVRSFDATLLLRKL